jgi:hypothetical protein
MSSDLSLTPCEIKTVKSWKKNVPAARERIKFPFKELQKLQIWPHIHL